MRNILHPLSGYKYCRRILKRYFWLGLILTLFFVTVAMTFDRAFGNTPPAKPKTSLYDNYLKTKPAATTTTTTVPHVERRIQTAPQVVPSTIPAPQGDWIPQHKTWMTQAGIPESDCVMRYVSFSRKIWLQLFSCKQDQWSDRGFVAKFTCFKNGFCRSRLLN